MSYKNQKEDQKTCAALRQAEESSDSETEDVVAELKSLSDSDTESEPDIPSYDAVSRMNDFIWKNKKISSEIYGPFA